MGKSLKKEVMELLERLPIGMTKFQIRNFVIGDQPLLLHQLRQVVNEIDVREATHHKIAYKAKKNALELEIQKEKLEQERDTLSPNEVKLRELEIEHETWKLSSAERTVNGCKTELDYLYDILDELTENTDTTELLDNFDKYDEIYWSKRLGKQAAADMASTGRISAGNLAAIELLPDEVKEQALRETIRLAESYNGNIQKQINGHEKRNRLSQNQGLNKSLVE